MIIQKNNSVKNVDLLGNFSVDRKYVGWAIDAVIIIIMPQYASCS